MGFDQGNNWVRRQGRPYTSLRKRRVFRLEILLNVDELKTISAQRPKGSLSTWARDVLLRESKAQPPPTG